MKISSNNFSAQYGSMRIISIQDMSQKLPLNLLQNVMTAQIPILYSLNHVRKPFRIHRAVFRTPPCGIPYFCLFYAVFNQNNL